MFPHFKSWPPKRSRLFHQQPSISIVECIVRSRVWYILCNASYFPALERSKYTIALTTDNQEVPPQRCNFTAASASKVAQFSFCCFLNLEHVWETLSRHRASCPSLHPANDLSKTP
eukprot:scaffold156996_cov22-Tisochrysis_lutea.AAC.1